MLAGLAASFVNGLAAPLASACVLPMYPGFLVFLSGQDSDTSVLTLGAIVSAGVVGFIMSVGLVFSALLGTSLSSVVQTISPFAFLVLGTAGLALALGFEPASRIPSVRPPQLSGPRRSALAYGLFFGAIALPCSAGVAAPFLGRALLFSSPVTSVLNFLSFGTGMAAPLLLLAAASDSRRDEVVGFVKNYSSVLNRGSGAVMFAVSVYYLVVVFGGVSLG